MVEINKIDEGRRVSIISVIFSQDQTPKKKNDGNTEPEAPVKQQIQNVAADFEEAMLATGFGRFNGLLLLCSMPAFLLCVYVTTAISYILTSAECDLKMDIVDMGTMNSIPYMGMMSSAMIWGYLSDTLGRKKIMVWGFFSVSICELVASQSQTYWFLVLSKFFTGFMFNGPFVVVISYLSEMHTANMRAKILLYTSAFYSIGNISLPLIAWAIIPNDWPITIIEGVYVLHSWHIFLALFTIPPIVTSVAFYFLPESPKFLMSRGRNEEALEVFKMIYSINHRKSPEEYPIKRLIDERSEKNSPAPKGWNAVKSGFAQLKPLIQAPYISRLLFVCYIQLGAMLGANTLRLWFPQMAAILEDYSSKHTESAPLCFIVENHISDKAVPQYEIGDALYTCETLEASSATYINSMIIGVCTMVAYLSGGLLVNTIGKRKLSALSLIVSSISSILLYWTVSMTETVTLFSIFVSMGSLSGSVLAGIVVDMFPTSIRAMAVAIFMLSGRIGTILGGLIFPHLLAAGCVWPFVAIGAILFTGSLMCFVLPRTTKKNIE